MSTICLFDYRFRWVYCQLEALRGCYPQTLRRTLEELPKTLDATYERTLLSIDKGKQKYACHLFQCLAVSVRPLRVDELAGILAVLLETEEDSEYHDDWCAEDAQQAVLSTCSTLITIVNIDGSPVVQFSHFSVKEFLTSSRLANAGEHLSRYHILPHSAHTTLSRALLTVLLSLGDKVDKSGVEKHPLALYASRYWVDHAKFEGVSTRIHDLMERLFDEDEPYFARWLWLYDLDRPWEGHMASVYPMRPKASPLYYATLGGLCDLVAYLSKRRPTHVNTIGGNYGNPLYAAVAKGYIDTASILVQYGADINLLDGQNRSPLQRASESGHYGIVKFLLEHQADVNIQKDNKRQTALHWAAYNGELEICRLLLKYKANLELRTENQMTPLNLASATGHHDIVEELLICGAIANVQDNDIWTPLHGASQNGDLRTVQLLVQHGAAFDKINDDQETPLHVASRLGNFDIARFLAEHGANTASKDKYGFIPLHLASQQGHLNIVEILLQGSMDANVQNANEETPLGLASGSRNLEVARPLIGHGADIDCHDNKG